MMIDEKYMYQAIKKMTLEEFANMINSFSEHNVKEDIDNKVIRNESRKIFYTIDELIEQYPFFTRYNINKAIQNDGLPYFMMGNRRKFNKEDVEKWIDKQSKAKKERKYDI